MTIDATLNFICYFGLLLQAVLVPVCICFLVTVSKCYRQGKEAKELEREMR